MELMKPIHISQKNVAALVADPKRDTVVWDIDSPGFGVRVSKAGVKSYVVSYYCDLIQRRYTIAKCSEMHADLARKKAAKVRTDAKDGIDPIRRRRMLRCEATVEQLAKRYLSEHAVPHKAASSVKEDRRMIDTRLKKIAKMRVSEVTQDDVRALHIALADHPYEANRVRSLLSKMFALAIEWKMRGDNPCKGVKKFREDRHEAWLTVNQFQALGAALDSYENQSAADCVRLLALTGCREGEALNATWDQFDLERGVWTRPAHTTKERKLEHVPLNDAAFALLMRMNSSGAKGFLFPRTDDAKRPRTTVRDCWEMSCRKAGLSREYQKPGKRRPLKRWKPLFRINDLRHSFASHLVSRGASLYLVGSLMGHAQPGTTKRYSHCSDAALRSTTNLLGNLITKTVQ